MEKARQPRNSEADETDEVGQTGVWRVDGVRDVSAGAIVVLYLNPRVGSGAQIEESRHAVVRGQWRLHSCRYKCDHVTCT